MGSKEAELKDEFKEKIFQVIKDFLTRIVKLEELGTVGSRLLSGFHQGLEYLRRPSINRTSELIENIIKVNETKRVKSYIEAGCINSHDSTQAMSKSKSILNELEHLLEDLAGAIQNANGCLSHMRNEDSSNGLDHPGTIDQEETSSSSSDPRDVEMTDYAAMMGIIYSMVKQDYVMQEKIVGSLNLKSPSGELDSYCLMWSLRPFINDEIMHHAWRILNKPPQLS